MSLDAGPVLPKAHEQPQKYQTRHQNGIALETLLFPLEKTQQVPQMYHSPYLVVSNEINKQNEHLLSRMLKIETEPMRNTINVIPKTIPSNKETFQQLKARERLMESCEIRKENIVLLSLFRKLSIKSRMPTPSTTSRT